MTGSVDDEDVSRQVRIMTTMHSVLSGTRTSIIHEGNGRAQMVPDDAVHDGGGTRLHQLGDEDEPRIYLFTFVPLS